MAEGPIERIVRDSGVPDLVELLSERLAPTDLQSLLLEVYRRRARRTSPADLLTRHGENRFTRPSALDPKAITSFEQLVWSLLPDGYRAIELSPLCPLGTSSVVATVDQNKVVSTIRNSEVVADPTNVLALECALRRRSVPRDGRRWSEPVRFVASQRQVRAQTFGGPLSWAHFRIVGMAAAGRDEGSLTFEARALCETIGYVVSLVARARPEWRIRVALTDLGDRPDTLDRAILTPLCERFPGATIGTDPDRASGRGYYVDACYKVYGTDRRGAEVEVADGGCATWTRQLLSDDKERLVIGGLGVERVLA